MQTEPIHKSNNLVLRFIANNLSSPLSHLFLNKSLSIYFKYEDQFEASEDFKPPFWDDLRITVYSYLYLFFAIPYAKWGTVYRIILEDRTDGESKDS